MAVVLLCSLGPALAEPDRQFHYQGRIVIDGKTFTGAGAFKFALLDAGGAFLWTSNTGPVKSGIPAGAVRLPVKDGVYSVVLGDAALGMPPVSLAVLNRTDPLFLRIWFDDGKHGVAQVGLDQPMSAVAATPPGLPAPTGATNDQIMAELREIRALLEKMAQNQATPIAAQTAPVTLPLRGGPALGSDTAPLTMVEFIDYQCPLCKQYMDTVFPQIKKNFIDTGKVRYLSRNYPLLQLHPFATKAAQAALCAAEQNKFWEMRAALFANNTALAPDDLLKYARNLGLDMGKFTTSLNTDKFQPIITIDVMDVNAIGMIGTPTFVLGTTAGKDSLTGGKIVGALPYVTFEAEINNALAACQGTVCHN